MSATSKAKSGGRAAAAAKLGANITPLVTENGLTHRSKARGLLNADNLPALQNLIKRDPKAYQNEFQAQWGHFHSLKTIYMSEISAGAATGASDAQNALGANRLPKEQQDKFAQLLAFVTQLAPSYPTLTATFPDELASLLLQHFAALTPDIRMGAVRSLVLLRNRDVIDSEQLLRTLFPLLPMCTSSTLRKLIQTTILQDLRTSNAKTKNHRLNRVIQGVLFGIVERGIPIDAQKRGKAGAEAKGRSEALWAVRLAAELWRRNIWNDAKTVALLAEAAFHPHPAVQSCAIRFFLGDLHNSEDNGSDEDSDADAGPDLAKLKHQRKVKKKTKAGDNKVRAAANIARKKQNARENGDEDDVAASSKGKNKGGVNNAAIHLLHDPQSFGEKLFENLTKGEKRHSIEMKVRIMQLLGRIMGAHKLVVLPFYSYVVKYLAPHQAHITLILVSLAASVHSQTPPDVLTPILRKLSDAFVHPGVGAEVVAAGLNSIREVCARQPWGMDADLLSDLIAYRGSKDKGTAAASRGLLGLYREVNPMLLERKERGKAATLRVKEGMKPVEWGRERDTQEGIAGIELLEKHLVGGDEEGGDDENTDGEEDEDEKGWENWEVESDAGSDDSGGWISVSSDEKGGGGFDISGSEDEGEGKGGVDKNGNTAKERALERREKLRAARRAGKVKSRKERKAESEESADESEEKEDSDDGGDGADSVSASAVATANAAASAQQSAEEAFSKLATTKILTPADFAKLHELRLAAAESAVATGGLTGAAARRELAALKSKKRTSSAAAQGEEELDEWTILGPRKKAKADYEERMKSIEKGREGREKFASRKKAKENEKESSTTNEKKRRGKNFQMVSRSYSVRNKKSASLKDKSKKLRKHIDKAKKRLK